MLGNFSVLCFKEVKLPHNQIWFLSYNLQLLQLVCTKQAVIIMPITIRFVLLQRQPPEVLCKRRYFCEISKKTFSAEQL